MLVESKLPSTTTTNDGHPSAAKNLDSSSSSSSALVVHPLTDASSLLNTRRGSGDLATVVDNADVLQPLTDALHHQLHLHPRNDNQPHANLIEETLTESLTATASYTHDDIIATPLTDTTSTAAITESIVSSPLIPAVATTASTVEDTSSQELMTVLCSTKPSIKQQAVSGGQENKRDEV